MDRTNLRIEDVVLAIRDVCLEDPEYSALIQDIHRLIEAKTHAELTVDRLNTIFRCQESSLLDAYLLSLSTIPYVKIKELDGRYYVQWLSEPSHLSSDLLLYLIKTNGSMYLSALDRFCKRFSGMGLESLLDLWSEKSVFAGLVEVFDGKVRIERDYNNDDCLLIYDPRAIQEEKDSEDCNINVTLEEIIISLHDLCVKGAVPVQISHFHASLEKRHEATINLQKLNQIFNCYATTVAQAYQIGLQGVAEIKIKLNGNASARWIISMGGITREILIYLIKMKRKAALTDLDKFCFKLCQTSIHKLLGLYPTVFEAVEALFQSLVRVEMDMRGFDYVFVYRDLIVKVNPALKNLLEDIIILIHENCQNPNMSISVVSLHQQLEQWRGENVSVQDLNQIFHIDASDISEVYRIALQGLAAVHISPKKREYIVWQLPSIGDVSKEILLYLVRTKRRINYSDLDNFCRRLCQRSIDKLTAPYRSIEEAIQHLFKGKVCVAMNDDGEDYVLSYGWSNVRNPKVARSTQRSESNRESTNKEDVILLKKNEIESRWKEILTLCAPIYEKRLWVVSEAFYSRPISWDELAVMLQVYHAKSGLEVLQKTFSEIDTVWDPCKNDRLIFYPKGQTPKQSRDFLYHEFFEIVKELKEAKLEKIEEEMWKRHQVELDNTMMIRLFNSYGSNNLEVLKNSREFPKNCSLDGNVIRCDLEDRIASTQTDSNDDNGFPVVNDFIDFLRESGVSVMITDIQKVINRNKKNSKKIIYSYGESVRSARMLVMMSEGKLEFILKNDVPFIQLANDKETQKEVFYIPTFDHLQGLETWSDQSIRYENIDYILSDPKSDVDLSREYEREMEQLDFY